MENTDKRQITTRKPSYRWQTRTTRKHAKNCSNSTCLQHCRWQLLAYLHSFSCCCVWNVRNPEKFTENSNLWSSRSSKVIDFGVNVKPICDFILVINSNFSRICYRFWDSRLKIENCRFYPPLPCLTPPKVGTPWDIDVIYTPLKSAFNGYNSVTDIIGLSSFV